MEPLAIRTGFAPEFPRSPLFRHSQMTFLGAPLHFPCQEDEWSPSPSGPASLQGSVSGNDGGLAAAGATPTPATATAAGAAAAAAPGDAPPVVLHAYQPGAVPKRPASHLKPHGEATATGAAAGAVGAGATAATKPPLPPGGAPARHVTLPSNGNGVGAGSGSGGERNRRLKKVQSVINAVKLSSAAQALAWSGLDGSSGPDPSLGLKNKDLFKVRSLRGSDGILYQGSEASGCGLGASMREAGWCIQPRPFIGTDQQGLVQSRRSDKVMDQGSVIVD